MTPCPHDLVERETAVAVDGYCPLCLRDLLHETSLEVAAMRRLCAAMREELQALIAYLDADRKLS
jgi:hypothetical protein